MRTSEEYLDINGTSQKIGMMFEQDADHIEPYISNVEDTRVPINMLHPLVKQRNIKMVAKQIEAQEIKDCSTSIEVPWELITLQVKLVEAEEETYQGGCCRDFIDPSCTRTNCPMLKYHSTNDSHSALTVQFHDKNYERKFEREYDGGEDDMDYEPAVTRRSIVTASTSEIHGSLSDIFEIEDDRPLSDMKRIPVETLIYDIKFDRHSEPYMDDMYNNFPDDNLDGICDSHIEIPWELFTLPTTVKIRKTKKAKPQSIKNKTNIPKARNAKKGPKNTVDSLDNIDYNPTKDEPVRTALNTVIGKPKDDLQSEFGFNMNLATESISNRFYVDGAAASQKSMSHYSVMSDFRFLAKRCPKNIAIGIDLFGARTSTHQSEMIEMGDDKNSSALTMELKPFTECLNKSEFGNILKQSSEETIDVVNLIGNMLTETQSLGANCAAAPSPPPTPTTQTQSMPEIPSRGNVMFPSQPVTEVVSNTSKGTEVPSSMKKEDNDPITSALDSYRAEIKPLREALDKLKQEVKELNLSHEMTTYHWPFSGPPQQYPNMPPMPYPASPVVRNTTAVSHGCGTRTPARMQQLFIPDFTQYNPMPFLAPGLPSPMPYYVPTQPFSPMSPMPYQVPGMVSFAQPPSDMFSQQDFSTIRPPSCKSRRKKKNRDKEGTSVTSKDSQLSEQGSSSRRAHPKKNKGSNEHNIQTHYGPKEMRDDSSEVSVKATSNAKKYRNEVVTEAGQNVQNEINTSEASHSIQINSGGQHAFAALPDTIMQQESIPENESINRSQNNEEVFNHIPDYTPGTRDSSSSQ